MELANGDTLTIYQGDDTNALGEEIIIVLNCDYDVSGFTAVFQLYNFRQKWDDISSKRLAIVIPKEETKKFKLGPCCGAIKIYDKQGRARTIRDDIKFYVKSEVVNNG